MQLIRKKIRSDYSSDSKEATQIEWDFAHKQVYGIEVNDRIARIAMMNMIIHEDAHGNIEHNNALRDPTQFDPRKGFAFDKFTLILTNPPLGKSFKEADPQIIANFKLGARSQVISVLMIEQCFKFLSNGGRLGIVLDDGVLNDPGYDCVRVHILENSIVKAVVSLSPIAFKVAAAGAMTSVVLLEKADKKAAEKDYPIFMAHVDHVGYDAVGRDDIDQLPLVLDEYSKFVRDPSNYAEKSEDGFWTRGIMKSELDGRLDAWHYYRPYLKTLEQIEQLNCPTPKLKDLTIPKGIFYPGRMRRILADKDQGVPFLSIRNVKEDGIDIANVNYVSKNTRNLKSYLIEKGWILLTRSGTVGLARNVDAKADGFAASEHIFRIIPKPDVDADYLTAILNSFPCQQQIRREKYGAVIFEISPEAVESLRIPYPEREETRKAVFETRKAAIMTKVAKLRDAFRLKQEGEAVVSKAEEEIMKLIAG